MNKISIEGVIPIDNLKHLLKIMRIGANEGFEMESKNVLVFDYINKVIINNY